MKPSIEISDDKKCSVGFLSEFGEFCVIKGLTPEQAVEIKTMLEREFNRGKWQQYIDTQKAMKGLEPKFEV